VLAEDLGERRQDLVAEVEEVLICRQWHWILLFDIPVWAESL
jgi:hypothetical protein